MAQAAAMASGMGLSLPTGGQLSPPASAGGLGNASGGSAAAAGLGSASGGTSGLAEGGSFLATTRQNIQVAENGPELIQATPLGRIGADVNKLFMQAAMNKQGGGERGMLELGVTLSPDLETRIVRKSLDEAAEVVMKVNRMDV